MSYKVETLSSNIFHCRQIAQKSIEAKRNWRYIFHYSASTETAKEKSVPEEKSFRKTILDKVLLCIYPNKKSEQEEESNIGC